jgi:hypothetical protein
MRRSKYEPVGRTLAAGRPFRHPLHSGIARCAASVVLAVCLLVIGGRSGAAGHQVGHYPSYYPDEIRIDVVDPKAAGTGLADATLHAYVGAVPIFGGPVPDHVKSVRSLGWYLTLSFKTGSTSFATAGDRCAAAAGILAALREEKSAGFVFHPYPITPFHADYLHHLDRVEAAKTVVGSGSVSTRPVKVGAKGQLGEAIVRARWGHVADSGDVALEAVPVDDLLAAAGVQFDGWSGPPWIKEGWFHAHLLLAPGLDATQRQAVDAAYERLVRGGLRAGLAEHADLERRLVSALTAGCHRMVVGYVLREEHFNEGYPEGVENIAYDSLSGLNSPVFLRTVKLKDYPWNGKLHLGVRDRAQAAWNPVGGFTDAMGRLMWSAVGDPAMFSFPFNASWMPNRVQAEVTRVEGRSGGIKVPADAVRPQPGSGALQRVDGWTSASAKVVYEVLASPFEDGTEQTVADLLYPFAFAYRWGAKARPGDNAREPRLEPVVDALQERLAGLKLVRVDQAKHAIAEGLDIVVKTPVLEVYLQDAPGDERQVAALAPPWSTVPWHLLALMEEAVNRGYAAFSQEEAARRKVPWLDLVRDETLKPKLHDLVAQFERESYRPEPLRDIVTADEAQARWRLVRTFAEKNGHFLVANGPYRLRAWTPDSVVLEAVRELTYPLGFGTFDRFVNPPRASIEAVTQDAGSIMVRADAEMILKMGRKYGLVKEPLLRTTMRGVDGLLVVSRYLVIDPDGRVVKVDKMQWKEDGHFTIDLPEHLAPGQYTVLLGIFLDGNSLQPSVKVLRVRVGAAGSPG